MKCRLTGEKEEKLSAHLPSRDRWKALLTSTLGAKHRRARVHVQSRARQR